MTDAIEYVSDHDEHAGLILTVNGGYIAIDDHDTLIWPVNLRTTTPCFPSAQDARSAVLRRFNDHRRTRRGLQNQRQAALNPASRIAGDDAELFSSEQVGSWFMQRYTQEPLRARGASCYVCASLGRPSNQDPILIIATLGAGDQSLTRFYHGHCYSINGRAQLNGFARPVRLA